MQTAIDQFRWNLARVRNLGSLHSILSAQTTAALNLTDLLRSELVMTVSTLDLYVHEVVRLGMLECFGDDVLPQTRFTGSRSLLEAPSRLSLCQEVTCGLTSK